MSWVRLEDNFFMNPKVVKAGPEARALYIAGLCYAAGGHTDGYIDAAALGRLSLLCDVRKPGLAADKLVSLRLWEHAAGGWQIHDFLKYQQDADEVRAREEVRVREDDKRAAGRLKGYAHTGRAENGRFTSTA